MADKPPNRFSMTQFVPSLPSSLPSVHTLEEVCTAGLASKQADTFLILSVQHSHNYGFLLRYLSNGFKHLNVTLQMNTMP